MTRTARATLLLSALLLAAGCGDDDGPADSAPPRDTARPADARVTADARASADAAGVADAAGSSADANPACQVPLTYGDLGTRTEPGQVDALAAPTMIWFDVDLNADPDTLHVDLYDTAGVFTDGLATGTYPLAGDDLDYATCGACIWLRAASTVGGDGPEYLATGGTLTITALTPNLQATLTDVTFGHVDISGASSTPIDDGCATAIGNLVIDSPLAE